MAPFWSSVISHITSKEGYEHGGEHGEEHHEYHDECHALPLIVSPVDPKAYAWLKHQNLADPLVPGKVQRSNTVAQFERDSRTDSKLAQRIFRKQHEASSIELFFDLFFVANLAIFTDQHAHVDAVSKSSIKTMQCDMD